MNLSDPMSTLGSSGVVALAPSFVWLIWLFVMICVVIISIMFMYHWNRYGTEGSSMLPTAKLVYIVGAIILVSIATSAALAVTLTA